MTARIRPASLTDGPALQRLDVITWSWDVSPSPAPPIDSPFFGAVRKPEDLLVATVDNNVVGYIKLGAALPLKSSGHVLEVQGLSVDPACGRRGIGRLLLTAAIREAEARGARRLTLRVLGPNTAARALYASCGFEVEGILHEEFLLDGKYVDDVLMAIALPHHADTW